MKHNNRLSNSEVAAFCEQLSLLLPAGITPHEAVTLMKNDSSSESEKAILSKIVLTLENGSSFYEALNTADVFPEYMLDMIHLGEESGTVDIIINKLTEYYKQQCYISVSIKNALTYPLVMIITIFLILVVLLTRILPIFDQVFSQLGTGLSGVAQKLLNIGYFLQSLSGFFLVLIILSATLVLFFIFSSSGKKWLHHILVTKGFTKNLYLYLSYAKLANALSIVTAAGLDIFSGISLARKLVQNELIEKQIDICQKELQQGNYLHEAIKEANIFSASQIRMLQIGHRSGDIDVVFSKISQTYEDKFFLKINKIIGAIEPSLVILFSLIVGLILLSVILPLIGIMAQIG